MNELIIGEGCVDGLSDVVSGFDDPILVMTGDRSFDESGAGSRIERQLTGRDWNRYIVRARLPGFEPALDAISSSGSERPGVLIAVGGGAVIDTAKLTALAFTNGSVPLYPGSNEMVNNAVRIVAIPTTAGSGAERTPFAVAYEGTIKLSVAHESIRPSHALVDPTLTYSLPPDVTASSGLDAIAHAIESAWAASATRESVELSLRALGQAWSNLPETVERANPSNRREMAEASTLAGAAIATAKTTVCHALSYYLTAVHGVPHGVAAALTLGPALMFNAGVNESNVSGERAPSEIVADIVRVCHVIGADDPISARGVIQARLSRLGVPVSLTELGLNSAKEVEAIIGSVNPERLANNPRLATADDLGQILRDVS